MKVFQGAATDRDGSNSLLHGPVPGPTDCNRTVEIHKARILRKTGIRSVVELARIVADAAEDAPVRRG